jgi:hypothetical protein
MQSSVTLGFLLLLWLKPAMIKRERIGGSIEEARRNCESVTRWCFWWICLSLRTVSDCYWCSRPADQVNKHVNVQTAFMQRQNSHQSPHRKWGDCQGHRWISPSTASSVRLGEAGDKDTIQCIPFFACNINTHRDGSALLVLERFDLQSRPSVPPSCTCTSSRSYAQ